MRIVEQGLSIMRTAVRRTDSRSFDRWIDRFCDSAAERSNWMTERAGERPNGARPPAAGVNLTCSLKNYAKLVKSGHAGAILTHN